MFRHTNLVPIQLQNKPNNYKTLNKFNEKNFEKFKVCKHLNVGYILKVL